jgi:hypothetical protein
MRTTVLTAVVIGMAVGLAIGPGIAAQQPNPRQQPGATVTMFAPEQHDLYDGRYVLSANRLYMVGTLNDPAGGITWTTMQKP